MSAVQLFLTALFLSSRFVSFSLGGVRLGSTGGDFCSWRVPVGLTRPAPSATHGVCAVHVSKVNCSALYLPDATVGHTAITTSGAGDIHALSIEPDLVNASSIVCLTVHSKCESYDHMKARRTRPSMVQCTAQHVGRGVRATHGRLRTKNEQILKARRQRQTSSGISVTDQLQE